VKKIAVPLVWLLSPNIMDAHSPFPIYEKHPAQTNKELLYWDSNKVPLPLGLTLDLSALLLIF
jgi:hypothetical protein